MRQVIGVGRGNIVQANVRARGQMGRGRRGGHRIAAGLLLAGTALAPVQAQTFDLAGADTTITSFAGFDEYLNTVGTAQLTVDTGAGTLNFSGLLTDDTGVLALRKTGAGALNLSGGGNSFSGGTTLDGGTLRFGNANVLGTGSVTVASASTLGPIGGAGLVLPNAIVINAPLTVTGQFGLSGNLTGSGDLIAATNARVALTGANAGFSGNIQLTNPSGGFDFVTGSAGTGSIIVGNTSVFFGAESGNVTLDNAIVIGNSGSGAGRVNFRLAGAGTELVLNGQLSGPGGIFLRSGAGTLVLNNAGNSYGTATTANFANGGIFGIGANGALQGSINAIDTINGNIATTVGLAAYANNLTVTNNAAVFGTLQFNTRGNDATYSGVLSDRQVAQVANFEKIGAGTLTLGGAQTYTGTTTVTAGRLDVAGTIGAGGTSVASGATLGGTGTIGGTTTVASGGTVSPGTATTPGVLNVADFTADAGSNLNFRLATPGVLGGGNDGINVTGNATVNGTINITTAPGASLREDDYVVLTTLGPANLTNNAVVGTAPTDFSFTTLANAGNLLVQVSYGGIRHWDGAGPAGDGTANGGNGTWNNGATLNFTDAASATAELGWRAGASGFFGGTGGTVTVDNGNGDVTFEDLTFDSSYTLNGDTLTSVGMFATGYSEVTVAAGQTVTINNDIDAAVGASFDKYGAGTLVLNGTVTQADDIFVAAGTLAVNGTANTGVQVQTGATLAGSGTLGDVILEGGSRLAPGNGALDYQTLSAGTALIRAINLDFEISSPGAGGVYDRLSLTGDLSLDGNPTFNLSGPATVVVGDYTLITYGGALNLNGFSFLTSAAPLGVTYNVDTGTAGSVVLQISLATADLYWDGAAATAGSAEGGSGTWNASNTNWETAQQNGANTAWVAGSNAFFTTSGGTVTVDGAQTVGDLTFTAGGYTITGDGITTTSGNIAVNAAPAEGATTIASVISGNAGLTVSGAGTLILSGANDFTGAVDFGNAGDIGVGNSAAFGAAANAVVFSNAPRLFATADGLNIANAIDMNGFLFIDSNGFGLTLSGNVTGGDLIKSGAGTLTLGGTNTQTTTTVTAGTLAVASAGALGAATLTLQGGTTLQAGADALIFTNSVALQGNATVDTNGFDLRLGGAISETGGAFGITKSGAGNLILAGNSSFSGGTTLETGRLILTTDTAAGTGAIAAAGGTTLELTGGRQLANAITLAGELTVETNGNFNQFDGVISGDGSLTVVTTAAAPFGGALALRGVNDFAGGVTIGPNAIVNASADSALGAAAGGLRINEGLFFADGSFTSARGVALQGSFGQIDVNVGETLTLTGPITGSQLRKGGAGTLIVGNGDNSYTGGTDVFTGELRVTASNALGTGEVVLSNDATLSATGTVSLDNSVNIDGAATVIDSGTGRLTIAGALTGANDVTKVGAGTLSLTADGTYSGTLQLTQGELNLEGSIAGNVNVAATAMVTGTGLANGTVTFADGANVNPGNSPGELTFGNLVLNNGTNLNFELAGVGAALGTEADHIVVNNNLTLDGVLNITGLAGFNVGVGNRTLITYGNLVADNGLTISNPEPVDVDYTILVGPVAAAGVVQLNVAFTGTYRWDGTDLAPDGTIDGGSGTFNLTNTNFTNSDGTFNLAYGNNATDDIEFGGTAGSVDVASAGINFDQMGFVTTGYTLGGVGSFNANGSAINLGANDARINTQITGGPLAKNGSGTLTLAGDNSFVGFDINGGTVVAASDTALGAGNVAMAAGTTLVAEGNRTLANAIGLAGSVTFDAATNDFTFNGAIGDNGPLTLVSTGGTGTRDGRVFLNGANTYGGGTTVNGTSVIIGADNGLGAAGTQLTLNDAELRTTASFTSNRGVTLAGGVPDTINTDAGTTLTLTGVVDGAARLQKTGTGTLVLGNAGNSYAGGTEINAGTLSIASNGALGALAGDVAFTGTSTLQTTANITSARNVSIVAGVTGTVDTLDNDVRLNGVISGDGTLAKDGTGRLTLTGTNTYAGGTNLNQGTLRIDDGNAIGSGTLTTQDGTTFVAGLGAGAGTITLANNVVLNGGQTTIDLNGNLLIINPVTGAVSTNGTNLVLNGTITGAGGFTTTNATAGTIVINGNNSFTGDVNLNSAVVFVGNDNALGTGNTININAAAGIRNGVGGTTRTLASAVAINDPNATVGGNGNLVLTGVVSGGSNNVFNKVGLGTVTLTNAANTIASQIEVAQGELAVTGNLTNANQLTNVRAGATLSGTGSIAGIVEVVNSGVLSAGVGGTGTTGTLTIGTLLLNEQSSLVFDLGDAYVDGGAFNDQIITTNLRLGGRLTVREATGGSFGLGVYNLIKYQGALMAGSNSVFVQTLPGSFSGVVQTLVPGEVNLVVTQPGTFIQAWDGADNGGAIDGAQGGTGTWSANGANWTGEDAQLNTSWFNNSVAVFGGTAGTVTLAQTFSVAGLQFATDGYVLQGGKISNESTGVGTGDFVFTSSNVNATINSEIDGNGILFKQGAGTLTLGGTNTNMTGPVQVQAGTLALANNRGAGAGAIQLGVGTTLQAAGGDRTIANAVQIASGSATIDSQAAVFTLNGVVSGNGGFAKIGTGNLVLNAANTYAGGTALDEGTITVGTNSALGTGALNMADGTTLAAGVTGLVLANSITTNGVGTIDSGTGTLTLNGTIGGAGSIAKTNSGTLVLNGDNSYAGGTNLTAGIIQVGSSLALGTGTLTTAGGTSLVAGVSGLTLANAVALGGTTSVDAGATGSTLTLAGVITGSGPLTKINTGTLILNGANGYTGGTALNAGTIQVGTSTALGTGELFMAGGTTLVAGTTGLSLGNAITTSGVGTIDSGTGTFTLDGVILGAGSLTKVNSGTLVLNGANGYAGGTNLTAGTIQVGTSTALGTGTLTTANATTLVAGAAGLNVANAAVLNGALTVDSGIGDFQLSGGISGPGSITKVNDGNLILSGSNSYAGGTNLNVGTLTITNDNSIGTGTLTTAGGTTVNAGLTPSGSAVITLANAVVLNGATALNLQGTMASITPQGVLTADGTTLTLNGVISGAGSLSASGLGRVTLNGANSYAGGTSLSLVAAYVGNDSAFGTGTVTTTAGGAIIGNDSGAAHSLANAVQLNDDLSVFGPDALTFNGVIAGGGALIKQTTGTVTLNGANSYTGGTDLVGGTIVVGTSTALGTGQLRVAEVGQSTTLRAGVDSLALANSVDLQQDTTNLVVDSQAFTFTLNGVIGGPGALTKVGSGNLVLDGANGYTGGTALTAGTITVGTNTALGTNTLAMSDGTTLAAGVSGLTVANAITTAGVGTIDSGTGTFTLTGVISGPGSIAKVNSGTLVLNGANTYAGGTALNAGTIQVGTNTALGTGTLTAADATTLVAGVSGLNVANSVVLNGGLTVNSGTGSFQLSGGISGAGSITKVNSGDLILSGSNSYAGGTNLTAGTLTVTNNNSIGTGTLTTTGGTTLRAGIVNGANAVITLANAVSLGAGSTNVDLQGSSLTFNNDASIVTNGASLTLNGVVSGDGGLNVTNFGTLTLNGTNSYAGGTVLNTRSVVYVGSDTAVGTGMVTTNAATGLYNISGATRTLANAFVLNGATWLGGTSDLVLNGGISGAGFVIKAGNQTLVLNGNNSFTGTSQLRDGRITVGTNSALGTGALRVFAPTVAPAPVAGLATTLAAGSTGLALANAITLDTGSNLIVESGTGSFTLNGVISGAGSLTKIQSGTLVLNGANSFTGGTALNFGTIQVGTDTALGTNTLAMAGGTTLQAGVDGLTVANAITTAGVGTVDTQAFTFTLNGVISGAGSIAKAGSGTLVLNGANTYAGGTALNAGTIQVGTNTALGTGTLTAADATTLVAGVSGLNVANSVVLNGGLTVDSSPGSFELSGGISGSGSITKVNRGNLILSGSNSYTGGTNLNAGTLTVTNGNSIGTGTLTTTGGTTLAAGTGPNGPAITLANAISLGDGTTTIALQGTSTSFEPDASISTDGTAFTLNGVINGAGGISTSGAGTLTLNGDNSYAGGTVLNNDSVAYAGSDTAFGTGTITINGFAAVYNVSGATRTLANAVQTNGFALLGGAADTLVLNGVVSGAGQVFKVGQNTLVLNGVNTYTGGTLLAAGNITVGTNSALGTGQLEADGEFGLGTSLTAGVSGLTIVNNVLLSNQANLVVNSGAGVFTLAGVIGGDGSLTKEDNGNLVLNGANTYTGGTTLNLGTITVGTNTALGTGTLAMGGGTTLAAGVSGLTVANAITTAGVGTVDTQAFTFTLNGVISGAGSIAKVGSGTLVLNGDNIYRGGTALNAGTIRVGHSRALGTGVLTTAEGTSLVAGVDGLVLQNVVQLGGATTVDTGSGSFGLAGTVNGSGPLIKVGTGTLLLSNLNTYTGGTNLNAGSVTVFSDSALGTGALAMADGTSLIAGVPFLTLANAVTTAGVGTIDSAAGDFTLGGVVSGPGSVRKIGSGNLVLNGANSFAGGLAITAGRVTAGTNTAAGTGTITLGDGTTLAAGGTGLTLANAIVTPGAGSIDQGSGTFTLAGVISGAGSLSAIGSGNLVLNGANSFAGGLAINNGTVTVGTNTAAGTGTIALANGTTLAAGTAGLALANAVTTAGAGTVNSGTGTFTLSGVVSGAGSIAKTGSGNLVLNGANTYAGGTSVNAGTLTVGTNTAAGTGTIILNTGTTLAPGATGLSLANAVTVAGAATITSGTGTFTLSGPIGGTAALTKSGTGTLRVTGTGTLSGATTVAQGTLNLNGSLASSAVTVQSGATLSGTGTTGALTVLAGGTVSPGNSPGTLNVNGAANLGGTYFAEVTAAQADRITATGALTVGGALTVAPSGTFNTFYQTFTLASGSSRTGTFSNASLGNFGAPFVPVLDYTATSVNLRLTPASLVTLGGSGLFGNQLTVAGTFDRAVSLGYNPQPFFNLYTQGANLPAALTELGGELHAAERRVILEDTRVVREAAFDRLNAGLGALNNGNSATVDSNGRSLTFWVRGAGSWGAARPDAFGQRFSTEQTGVLGGFDLGVNNFIVGAMFNYTNNDIRFDSSLGQSRVRSVGGAVYAGYRQPEKGFAIGGGVAVADLDTSGSRSITAPGLTQSLRANYGGTAWQVFGEVAYDLSATDTVRIEPFARYAYANGRTGAFQETGGIAQVAARAESRYLSVIDAGIRGGISLDKLAFTGSLAWHGVYGSGRAGRVDLTLDSLPTDMRIRSVALDRNAAAVELQARYSITPRINLGVGYSGIYGDRNTDHGARGTLTIGF